MFLKNRNIISKMKRSKVTDYAALMLHDLGWLSVPDRYNYNKALVAYRAINSMSPEYQLMVNYICVPKTRTALYKSSFSCSAPRLWSALPQTAKTKCSLSTFKQSLLGVF